MLSCCVCSVNIKKKPKKQQRTQAQQSECPQPHLLKKQKHRKGTETCRSKKNTCVHLFPISCMLSSSSIGQETWCGFFWVFVFNFPNFRFCFLLLPKASCEEMRVSGELQSQYGSSLVINAGICCMVQEAQFEVHFPNQAEHGWEAIWGGGTGAIPRGCLSDVFSSVFILCLPLPPLLSKPFATLFQESPRGLREKRLGSSHQQGMGLQGLLWTDSIKDVGSEEKCMSYGSLCNLRSNENTKTCLSLPSEILKFWYTEDSGEYPDPSFLWLHSLWH